MGRHAARYVLVALLALAFVGHVHCQDDDYGGEDEPYDPEDEDYGGEGPDSEEAPPPPGDVRELFTVEDFETFLDDEDASVVAAFTAKEVLDPAAKQPDGWDEEEDGAWAAPTIENPALTSFTAATSEVYGYRYAYTTSAEVLAKMSSKKGGVYLYRSPKFLSVEHGDRPRERYPADKLSSSGLENWLKAKAQPLVGLYNSQTKSRYDGGAVLVIFMNLNFDTNAKSVNYVLKRARKAAKALKESGAKLSVALAAVSSFELGDFGLESKNNNVDVLMGISKGLDYYGAPAGTAFSAKALDEFAQSFLGGKLQPYVKPDPEPDTLGDDAGDPYDGAYDGTDDDHGDDDFDPETDEDVMKDEP